MLDDLIGKFKDAEGRSEFVIVVVCDIRNFSGFSTDREAPEMAIFIARFYEKLLSEYFTDAVYAKPTGDGLIMVFKHKSKQADLLVVAESVLNQCLRAIADYPAMLANDLMINFKLPEKIGFGVARGTATCLFAGDEIIDYSGQILNLAARLNDLAKPGGVVIDQAFLLGAIPENLQGNFRIENVYIRGISEEMPREIFCTKEVIISEAAKHPLHSHNWKKWENVIKYSTLKNLAGYYSITLPDEPISKDLCKIKLYWDSKISTGIRRWVLVSDFYLNKDAEGFEVGFIAKDELITFKDEMMSDADEIKAVVHYVPKIVEQKDTQPTLL